MRIMGRMVGSESTNILVVNLKKERTFSCKTPFCWIGNGGPPTFLWKNCSKLYLVVGFHGGSDSKESACNVGDPGSIPGSGRSSGIGNGYPLQYSCLEKSMDRGAWWATVHGDARFRHDWVTNTMFFWSFCHWALPLSFLLLLTWLSSYHFLIQGTF